MRSNPPPFYDRILFKLLLPVILVGILGSTLLVTSMSAPMKDFLTRQFDANLRTASVLGLRVCDESFTYLLDLRLENNQEMNQVLQKEAIDKINAIGSQFPQIHIMVLQSGDIINACHPTDVPEEWKSPALADRNDTAMVFEIAGQTVRSRVQSFPFWDWHVISFVFEKDYMHPVRMAYLATYLSALGTFAAVVVTLLVVFHLFINKPLNRLVAATDGVAEGQLEKIDRIAANEFGRLMASFNAMIDSLGDEKRQVNALIHELKESEERFKALHKASFGGITIHDKGVILECNQGLSDITGYSLDELVGMNGLLLIAEKSRKLVAEKIAAGFEKPYEAVGLRKNGSEYPIRLEARNIPYKGKQVRTVEFRDITAEKQAEAELRRLKNYLSNIIDSMPSVLVGVDGEGKVTQWNRQAEEVTGISEAQARSQLLADVFPRLRGEMDNIQAAIRERRVLRDMKVPYQGRDETRYEDVTIFPLIANGVEGAVIRVDDVTQQVRWEEMMIQSEKMLSVGGLAAGMAHEINNPLAGMLQSTSVLQNRLLGDLPANHKAAETAGTDMAAIRKYLELRKLPNMLANISISGTRAAAIVKNMLSFSRKSEKIVSSHDLAPLLDQTLELVQTDYDMKKRYDFKKITILREYDEGAAAVPCEASKIQQVFMNILRNGAEAMAEAQAAPESPTFILRVRADGDWIRVEIEDNGPCMDEMTRRRIFEPFFTTKPVGQGTGLGLSVSYFIITEDHGGEMSVEAAESGGTWFVIRLPKQGSPERTNHETP